MKSIIAIVIFLSGYQSIAQNTIHRVNQSPYPSSSQSDTLYLFHDDLLTDYEILLLQSIQGLLAKTEPRIYRDRGGGSSIWINDLAENYNVFVSDEFDGNLEPFISLYYSQFSGYVLCNVDDNSANVANSICGPLNAIAVTPQLQDMVESFDIPMLADVREKEEQWVLDQYESLLNKKIVTYQREDKSLFLGDYSIFTDALHFYDDIHSSTTENSFSRMEPNSILFGWGDDEYQTVSKASSYSIGVHPADWGFNISTLTNFNAETSQHVSDINPLIEEGTHTVCFLMSDGDNVQWMLNSFADDSRWFGSPNRGLMDIGWTIPPSLSEIAPTVMSKIYSMAADTDSGKDYFVAGPSGLTYHFPETFPALEVSCNLMNEYLNKSDLSIVNILGNEFDEAVFHQFLKQEHVDGLFYYDYSDYSKEKGRMDCFALKPVIAGKYNLWGGFESCESLAEKLNNENKDPYSQDGYSLVAVHNWSNSVDSLLYVRSLLEQGVRVVSPDEFVQLISKAICSPLESSELITEAYPNPFMDKIKLRIRSSIPIDLNISVKDLNGRSVPLKIDLVETIDGWIYNLIMYDISEGMYFLHYDTGTQHKTTKFVKTF